MDAFDPSMDGDEAAERRGFETGEEGQIVVGVDALGRRVLKKKKKPARGDRGMMQRGAITPKRQPGKKAAPQARRPGRPGAPPAAIPAPTARPGAGPSFTSMLPGMLRQAAPLAPLAAAAAARALLARRRRGAATRVVPPTTRTIGVTPDTYIETRAGRYFLWKKEPLARKNRVMAQIIPSPPKSALYVYPAAGVVLAPKSLEVVRSRLPVAVHRSYRIDVVPAAVVAKVHREMVGKPKVVQLAMLAKATTEAQPVVPGSTFVPAQGPMVARGPGGTIRVIREVPVTPEGMDEADTERAGDRGAPDRTMIEMRAPGQAARDLPYEAGPEDEEGPPSEEEIEPEGEEDDTLPGEDEGEEADEGDEEEEGDEDTESDEGAVEGLAGMGHLQPKVWDAWHPHGLIQREYGTNVPGETILKGAVGSTTDSWIPGGGSHRHGSYEPGGGWVRRGRDTWVHRPRVRGELQDGENRQILRGFSRRGTSAVMGADFTEGDDADEERALRREGR